jgi:hypothetical protein
MVKTGMVTPLWYTDLVTPDGEVKTSADVPELLPFTEFYRKVMGKSPSGVKYEALKAANMSSTNMQRTILLSPGSPEAAAAAMRQAVEGRRVSRRSPKGDAFPAEIPARRGRHQTLQAD